MHMQLLIELLLSPTWLKHVFACLSPMQSHPDTLSSTGEVQESGSRPVLLGLETLCCAPQKGSPNPHQNNQQEFAGARECALHTNMQHWDTGHGAAHTFCISKQRRPSTNPLVRRPKPSTFTHKVMNHEHELLDAPIVCYRNGAFQTEREKSEDWRVYSKPIKRTTLKCFGGTIYVNSKNPSLDLF